MTIERRTHTEVNALSARRRGDADGLPQNGDLCIMAPVMKLGASLSGFTRPLGLNVEPQKAIRFVVSFDLIHSVTSPRQLHHLSRGVIYPTGLMKPKNQHFEMFFFTGLTSLNCPAPVTRTPRRTSPIASASLKITLCLLPGTVPSNLIPIPPCVSKRPLPYLCHSTSLRDLVPRRQWTHRTSKGPSSLTEISTQPPPSEPLISTTTTLKLDSSLQCPPSPAPRPSPRSAMVVLLTRSLTLSMKVGTPLWQADILDRGTEV